MDRYHLHSALRSEKLGEATAEGVQFVLVKLRVSRDTVIHTLHSRPSMHTTSGLQRTDFLHHLGFRRSGCSFLQGECYVREVKEGFDLKGFADRFDRAYSSFPSAGNHFERCGVIIPQPEGWGFFRGRLSICREPRHFKPSGDGHTVPKSERLKEAEDERFRYVLSWIDTGREKGWVIHYQPRGGVPSPEVGAVLGFVGGFESFGECPEFDFQPCLWRFFPFTDREDDLWGRAAEEVHKAFEEHPRHFRTGIEQLININESMKGVGMPFLDIPADGPTPERQAPIREGPARRSARRATLAPSRARGRPVGPAGRPKPSKGKFKYDVALSFAKPERPHAEELARVIQDAGYKVFYDDFYKADLWGKNLVDFFDGVYRKESRFCVIFVSKEYSQRFWTNHERQSAQARALKERGMEFILPVKVDETELEGMPDTVGYVSLRDHSIQNIAELLLEKLRGKPS